MQADKVGFVTAMMLSAVGTGAGMYACREILERFLE